MPRALPSAKEGEERHLLMPELGGWTVVADDSESGLAVGVVRLVGGPGEPGRDWGRDTRLPRMPQVRLLDNLAGQ